MLGLKNIKKEYKVADSKVHALKGINLGFRENEFVSILGPSGCGKTTMLNIIGGLDKYTSGDLSINGKSTKEFKDKDWDVYRNHRIGFIFQNYNLIPHQTVLGNVELALTISGLSKAERVKKAKAALDKVGLSDQYNKRPNQLSGGQSQRVAIARALVNDPEILLADEPTGALDTVTSVQIMDLIKEIAKEKLVIMVTHNPELAEKYSTRIIQLLDGEVISDSMPYLPEENKTQVKTQENSKEKAKMSFFTAFKLSLQNLFTKKARTVLTSIAGSIGIIGVSLVLALSFGIQTYINTMQNDMLSGYPIQITKTAIDINALSQSMPTQEKAEILKEAGFINVDATLEQIMKRASAIDGIFVNNNITQDYVDYISQMPQEDVASLLFDYGIDITNNIYTEIKQNASAPAEVMSLSTIRAIYTAMLKKTDYSNYASLIPTLTKTFAQAPASEEYILSQYNKVHGNFAKEKHEIMIVLDGKSMLSDLLLAQLGFYTQKEFLNVIYKASGSPNYNPALQKTKFSYNDLVGKTFTWYPNNNLYNAPVNPFAPFTYNAYYNSSFTNGIELEIVGILEPKQELAFGSLTSGFYYTQALTNHILQTDANSEITTYLKDNNLDSFVGMKVEVSQNPVIYKDLGVTMEFSFEFEGETITQTSYLGTSSSLQMFGGGSGQTEILILSLGALGGNTLPEKISIYPSNFKTKENVLKYLDKWNSDQTIILNGNTLTSEQRSKITYTDNLSLVISLIQTLISVVTIALVGFTALSLVVSSVMIAIITYVSVVERVKEIGVIRSLGGRKKDVANLFNAETFIIGLTSGLIGIGFTYFVSAIVNIIVKPLIGFSIAIFPIHYALIMLAISVFLTLVSGFMPAKSAAKKDPVVALRTEWNKHLTY